MFVSFIKKLGQSLIATIAIMAVVFLLMAFNVVPFEKNIVIAFIIGGVMLAFGQALFLVG